MKEGKQPFKVIIVGGSIAGLCLANMLERLDIDFVVLEAYSEIAPQLGASITIWPHLARILDQIGCWWHRKGDALQALADTPCNRGFYRDQHGETLFEIHGMADVLERRHGYPVIFIQRQMLVQALYDKLRCKHKVFVQRRLVRIQPLEHGVLAITKCGDTYTGDIIIGADGMHSAVRRQMHILGNTLSPGYFDRDEYSKVPCAYKCIFGIAHAPRGIEKGTTHIVMGKNYSHAIMTGSSGKVFFFLNVKDKAVTHGKSVPRYSVEDERALAEQHFQDRLNEHDTFGDVYNARIISKLTPLHEYQWKTCYFDRIMTIGDAAHKMHPISGNGGAAAVEDAAALVNALQRKLKDVQYPSTKDFQDVFAEAQHSREKRTRSLLEQSTKMQQLDAMESTFSSLTVRYVLPHLTGDAFFSPVTANVVQGPRCEFLPTPRRDRYVPFDDELPSARLRHVHAVATFFIIVYSLLFYLSWVPWSESSLWKIPVYMGQSEHHFNTTTTDYVPDSRESIHRHLSSIILMAPIILIWNIDTSRLGNIQPLGPWPVTFLILAAFYAFKPETLLPLYLGISFCSSYRNPQPLTAGRPVPLPVIEAANTVTWVIYATLALSSCLLAFFHVSKDQSSCLSRFFPLCVSMLIHSLAAVPIFRKQAQGEPSNHDPKKEYMKPYFNQDYSPLTTFYKTLIVLSFLSSLFIASWSSPDSHGLVTANLVTQCLQIVFDLRRLGYITSMEAICAAPIMIMGTAAVGPVTVYIGSRCWREGVIHRLSD